MNSGPVLEDSVHATAVEQFKAGSPSGQGDWAVMKIPQERSEGNSERLFVMGKRRRKGQKEKVRTHSVCLCVCVRARACVCSGGGQVVPPNINKLEGMRWKGIKRQRNSEANWCANRCFNS